MPEFTIELKNGTGSAEIKQWTAGKTLSGKATITHDMVPICPPMETDIPETWGLSLLVNNQVVVKADNIMSGQAIFANNIKTSLLGKTTFKVVVTFSKPWDLTAIVNLEMS